MHLLGVFPLFLTVSSLSASPWSPASKILTKSIDANFSDSICSLICGSVCVQLRDEWRKKRNSRVRWSIKKTDLPADSSGLFYCTNLMTKATHVLPNWIRNAPTTLHSRGSGSVDTTFLLLWDLCGARVRTQEKKRMYGWRPEDVGNGGWEGWAVLCLTCMK